MFKPKFKNVTDEQVMELMNQISKRMMKGVIVEDGLLYVQMYAVCEQLLVARESCKTEPCESIVDMIEHQIHYYERSLQITKETPMDQNDIYESGVRAGRIAVCNLVIQDLVNLWRRVTGEIYYGVNENIEKDNRKA